jgi:hypothetical protein
MFESLFLWMVVEQRSSAYFGKDDRLVTFKPMLRLVKKSGLGKTFEFSSYT